MHYKQADSTFAAGVHTLLEVLEDAGLGAGRLGQASVSDGSGRVLRTFSVTAGKVRARPGWSVEERGTRRS